MKRILMHLTHTYQSGNSPLRQTYAMVNINQNHIRNGSINSQIQIYISYEFYFNNFSFKNMRQKANNNT